MNNDHNSAHKPACGVPVSNVLCFHTAEQWVMDNECLITDFENAQFFYLLIRE